jgi:indolepyruvate ferredoxin oxidoreductase beta subunit
MTAKASARAATDPGPGRAVHELFEILLAGVGGQGVLTAAKLLGDAAHRAGRPVSVGQLHGMSQRGGSVECTVLIGPRQSSFPSTRGVDVLVAFEPLEAWRAMPALGPHTHALVNLGTIVPFPLVLREEPYPSVPGILAQLERTARRVIPVDGPALTRQVGVDRTLNVVMLGALAGLRLLPMDVEALRAALVAHSPARFREANELALAKGAQSVNKQ